MNWPHASMLTMVVNLKRIWPCQKRSLDSALGRRLHVENRPHGGHTRRIDNEQHVVARRCQIRTQRHLYIETAHPMRKGQRHVALLLIKGMRHRPEFQQGDR